MLGIGVEDVVRNEAGLSRVDEIYQIDQRFNRPFIPRERQVIQVWEAFMRTCGPVEA